MTAPPLLPRCNTSFPTSAWRGPACRSDATLITLLILFAIVPYANTLLNGLVYDDNTQVLNNPYIQSFRHLREIFGTTVWSYVGAQGVTNYYRPLMTFGYLLCYQLFGPLAYGFHLVNVALHAAVVCLLFKVTARLFGHRTLGFVAAAVFALHPIHTESVAWVAALPDLQVTFFSLLTFWFFLARAGAGRRRSELAGSAMVASFVLTALSKEQALVVPLLATVYEHFYRDDRGETTWRQKLSRYGALWLLAAAYLLFRIRILGGVVPVLQISSLTWCQTVLSALSLMGQYLWKLVWPVQLCAFYVFRRSLTPLDPRVLAGLAALLICAALFVALWRRARVASFALFWLLVTLAPVLNARWMAANVFAERYLYLPSVGFSWIVAFAWVSLWSRVSSPSTLWRRALLAMAGVVAVLCVVRIVIRNRDWQNDIGLYTRTLAASPDASHIRNNLGKVYWDQGDARAAEREWREALKRTPRSVVILNNLGLVYRKQKRYDEAVDLFRQAMRLRPNYTDPHLNLGVAYAEMGLREQAELQLRAAVALSPLNIHARNQLGQLYFEAARLAEAEEQFRASVESEPNAVGYDGLGDVYLRWGKSDRAEYAFRRAVSLNLFDSHARFSLGAIYTAQGRNVEALREYQAGLETDPANPEALRAVQELRR